MKRHLRHVGKILLGFALVLVGIAGLILPILPGWPFLIPGLILLADYFPPLRRLLDACERWIRNRAWPWVERKYPRLHARLHAWVLKIHAETAPYMNRFR